MEAGRNHWISLQMGGVNLRGKGWGVLEVLQDQQMFA